jgi:glutathione S-transferase
MMVLHTSPASPFGRKVRIGASMLGLSETVEIVFSDPFNAEDRLRVHNPLGKIPALVLDDGPVLFDSRVILEYLDHRAGGAKIVPAPCDARFRVKTEEVLADGLTDAAVLQVYEGRFRDASRHESGWLHHQSGKVDRALDAFERLTPEGPRTVADIALACALGYLDLRFAGVWRDGHPRLVEWLANFGAEVPAFEDTRFRG